MEEIVVPAPPKTAFNKHRRISDLIKKQVEHFKHIEYKLSPEQRATIPQHAIATEDEAARYIAAMTRLLRNQPAGIKIMKPMKLLTQAEVEQKIALAASAEDKATRRTEKPAKAKPSSRKSKGKA
jgi:hypothetical protein